MGGFQPSIRWGEVWVVNPANQLEAFDATRFPRQEAVKKLPGVPIQLLLLIWRWQYTVGNEQTTASSSPGFD
jgi:hypothetical protein